MMNSPRLESFIAMSLLVLVTAVARGEETEAGRTPTRFRELLHVGDTVLLRAVTDHPVYTIRLLSEGQAEEIQTAYAAYLELRQRGEAIIAQLEAEGRLNERADLFVQQQTLGVEMANLSSAQQLGPIAYEVAQVGEDFITLKRPGIEKFVPLQSIRDMYRTEELSEARSPSSLRRRSPADPAAVTRLIIRLRNTTATEVAAAVHKVYPDLNAKLTVDATANSLLLEGNPTSTKQIAALISALDAALPEATPPVNERGQ